jgi:hypothetical protein
MATSTSEQRIAAEQLDKTTKRMAERSILTDREAIIRKEPEGNADNFTVRPNLEIT